MLVQEVDFSFAFARPSDIGWKALAVNASDIAAMGGIPRHAVVSVGLRPETSLDVIDGFLEGLAGAASEWGIDIAGGDLSRADEFVVSVALTGVPGPGGPVLRSGARVGDAICVTGSLGGAAAGLALLRSDELPEWSAPAPTVLRRSEDWPTLQQMMLRQLRPRARVAEGAVLAARGASSMIDLSDGLVVDLERLMRASNTGCETDLEALPRDPGLKAVAQVIPGFGVIPTVLAGGEDYELLFTIDPELVADTADALFELKAPVTRIGTVTEGESRLWDRTLEQWKNELTTWDHLRGQ
jgi:thiamine-monophosphate kinase